MAWLELPVLMLPFFSFVVSDNMDTFSDSAVANVFMRKNNVQRVSEVVLTVARMKLLYLDVDQQEDSCYASSCAG